MDTGAHDGDVHTRHGPDRTTRPGPGLDGRHRERVRQLTGIPSILLGAAAGSFSRLTWMGVAPDARAADEASRTMNADDGYLKLIARGGQYFVDRSARTQLFLRIA